MIDGLGGNDESMGEVVECSAYCRGEGLVGGADLALVRQCV